MRAHRAHVCVRIACWLFPPPCSPCQQRCAVSPASDRPFSTAFGWFIVLNTQHGTALFVVPRLWRCCSCLLMKSSFYERRNSGLLVASHTPAPIVQPYNIPEAAFKLQDHLSFGGWVRVRLDFHPWYPERSGWFLM